MNKKLRVANLSYKNYGKNVLLSCRKKQRFVTFFVQKSNDSQPFCTRGQGAYITIGRYTNRSPIQNSKSYLKAETISRQCYSEYRAHLCILDTELKLQYTYVDFIGLGSTGPLYQNYRPPISKQSSNHFTEIFTVVQLGDFQAHALGRSFVLNASIKILKYHF